MVKILRKNDCICQYMIQGIHVYLIDLLKVFQVIPNDRRGGIDSIEKKSTDAQSQSLNFEIWVNQGHFK